MSPYTSDMNGANDPAYPLSRRAVLGGLASTPMLATVPELIGGRQQARTYSVVQGDRCFPITPLRGDEAVEQLYELHVPERFTGDNGAVEGGTGPYYESLGTIDLQRPDTTICFLYEGPHGLSFVAVHDHVTDDTGGSVSWTVTGLPATGSWTVKDSLLIDPETGELATVELDRWDVSGATHTIDWAWGMDSTDGGAFRGLDGEFSFTITPAFNEAAALWGMKNHGRITDWQFLSWSDGELTRHSVALDRAVTVRSGRCEGRNENVGGSEDSGPERDSNGGDENAERSGEAENGDDEAGDRDDDEDEEERDDDEDEHEGDDENDDEDDEDDDDEDDGDDEGDDEDDEDEEEDDEDDEDDGDDEGDDDDEDDD